MGIISDVKDMAEKTFMNKLLDMNDNSVSSTNFFVIIVTIVGIILLTIPVGAIIVDLIYNHTVTMSWSDIAAFITSVAAMFASVGITKAWTSWSNAKYQYLNKLADPNPKPNPNEIDNFDNMDNNSMFSELH